MNFTRPIKHILLEISAAHTIILQYISPRYKRSFTTVEFLLLHRLTFAFSRRRLVFDLTLHGFLRSPFGLF